MLHVKKALWRYRNFWWIKKQSSKRVHARLINFFGMLMLLCFIHALAMVRFEQLSFFDALWVTFTTVTTVGYGDFSAGTVLGRIATIVFMYVAGISLMAQLAGEFIDYRLDRKQRMITGKWRWEKMQDHILIVNVPAHDTDRYMLRFVNQIRSTPGLEHTPIQVLTRMYDQGLPMALRDLGVVHRCAEPTDSAAELEAANVRHASCIFVLAKDAYDASSDSISLDILFYLKDFDYRGHLVVEAVSDENKHRFKQMGANSVLRPVRAYPEMLVRALVAPGSEIILEELFTHGGARPERLDLEVSGKWGEIAATLMEGDYGLPLGYIDLEGQTHVNPRSCAMIQAKALLVMLSDKQPLRSELITQALSPLATQTLAAS